jgi:hypothetical protein
MSTPVVSLTLLLLSPHHLTFPLQALCLKLFGALFYTDFRLLEICGKSSMCAVLASLAFWTESA